MKGNTILIGLMSLVLVALLGVVIVLLVNRPVVPVEVSDRDRDAKEKEAKKEREKEAQRTSEKGDKEKKGNTDKGEQEEVVARPGKPVETKTVIANPPEAPTPIANETLLKMRLKQGKTYDSTYKGGFVAKAYSKDWGISQEVNVTYLAEMQVSRFIEVNDGQRIVELRHIQKCRNAKLDAKVENTSINLGFPGLLVLGVLDSYVPGTIVTVEAVQPFAEAFLSGVSQYNLDANTAKAVASVNSLSGKKVRIEYVDGKGVTSLEPVGCELTESEFNYLAATAVLSDCYIFPEVDVAEGKSWPVDGRELAGLLDPTLRGTAGGSIRVSRGANKQIDGHPFATLSVVSGTLTLDSSDEQKANIAKFTPTGVLHFSLEDGYVTDAELNGDAELHEVSKDHILFEAEFLFQPQLEIQYSCKMR